MQRGAQYTLYIDVDVDSYKLTSVLIKNEELQWNSVFTEQKCIWFNTEYSMQ